MQAVSAKRLIQAVLLPLHPACHWIWLNMSPLWQAFCGVLAAISWWQCTAWLPTAYKVSSQKLHRFCLNVVTSGKHSTFNTQFRVQHGSRKVAECSNSNCPRCVVLGRWRTALNLYKRSGHRPGRSRFLWRRLNIKDCSYFICIVLSLIVYIYIFVCIPSDVSYLPISTLWFSFLCESCKNSWVWKLTRYDIISCTVPSKKKTFQKNHSPSGERS